MFDDIHRIFHRYYACQDREKVGAHKMLLFQLLNIWLFEIATKYSVCNSSDKKKWWQKPKRKLLALVRWQHSMFPRKQHPHWTILMKITSFMEILQFLTGYTFCRGTWHIDPCFCSGGYIFHNIFFATNTFQLFVSGHGTSSNRILNETFAVGNKQVDERIVTRRGRKREREKDVKTQMKIQAIEIIIVVWKTICSVWKISRNHLKQIPTEHQWAF